MQLLRVVYRQGGHDVERSFRMAVGDAGDFLQALHHGVPAAAVFRLHLLTVGGGHGTVQRRRSRLVQSRGAKTALADFHGLGNQMLIPGNQRPYPRAAGRETLGHRIDHHHIFCPVFVFQHGMQGFAAVDNFTVDLVGDQEQVPLPGDIQQQTGFLLRQHRAGGIAGVRDKNRPGLRSDQRLDALPAGKAVAFLRAGGNGTDRPADGPGEGGVVGIEGLRHQDFVPLVQHAGQGQLQRLTAAERGQNVTQRQFHAQGLVIIPHGLQIDVCPGGRRVGQHVFFKIPHGVKEGRGGGNVGLPDVQMKHFAALCFRLHHIGMEFADGGKSARLYPGGKFHILPASLQFDK